MLEQEVLPVGLTFDDVLLIPAESSVLPRDINVATRLTDRITLNIPLVSAAIVSGLGVPGAMVEVSAIAAMPDRAPAD